MIGRESHLPSLPSKESFSDISFSDIGDLDDELKRPRGINTSEQATVAYIDDIFH